MNIFDLQAIISLNAEQFNSGLQEAQGNFANFGGNVSKGAETLKKGLAVLGGAAVAAGAGIVKGTVSAAYAADDLNTLSKQTGIATDTLQKFMYASDLIDVPIETLTGSLKKLTMNMDAARDGTGEAGSAFDALGVSVVNTEGELRNNEEVFYELISALGQVQNSTERDSLALDIFGKSAQDLNPLILGGADALTELGQQAEDAGLILSQDALNGLNELSDALDTAKASASGLKNLFGTAFASSLAGAITAVTGFAQEVTSAFQEGFSTDGISGALESIGSLISSKFSGIASDVASSISSMTGPIGDFAGAFQDVAGDAVSTFTGKIAEFAATVATVSVDTVSSIAGGIRDFISAFDQEEVAGIIGSMAAATADLFGAFMSVQSDAIKDTGNAVKVFVDSFDNEGAADAMTSIASKASELFSAFSSAVADRVRAIGERFSGFGTKIAELAAKFPVDFGILGEAISGLIGTLTDFASKVEEVTRPIREFFGTAFSTIFQGAVGVVVGAAGGIVNALASIVTFVNGSLRGLGALISGDFTGAAEAVKSAWGGMAGFFKGIWDAIKGAFSGAKQAFAGIGRDLVEGLKSGFTAAWDSFKSTVSNLANGLVNGVKDFFGIHSPSRLFAGIGQNLVLGMEQGWSSGFGSLVHTVGGDMASLASIANLDFEKSAIGLASAAGISSIAAADMAGGASRAPVEVNLVLDGEVAAKALFDPLRGVAYQKGKAAELYA